MTTTEQSSTEQAPTEQKNAGNAASHFVNAMLQIARKDFQLLLTDKVTLFFTFVFPLLFALLFGSMMGGGCPVGSCLSAWALTRPWYLGTR